MSNPKLTVLFEKMRGKMFELDKDVMTAGRKPEMDICVKDGTMSSHHCDFIRSPDGSYIIRDNDSTNGTRVNNIQIKEQKLKNSDIIQLGGVEFLYDAPDEDGSDSFATSTRSHTIDLSSVDSNLATVRELGNFSPFAESERKKSLLEKKIITGVLAFLALCVFILLIWVVFAANSGN